jgi:hypothetical protein
MRAFYVADKSAELLVTFMVSFFIQYLCITAFKKENFAVTVWIPASPRDSIILQRLDREDLVSS